MSAGASVTRKTSARHRIARKITTGLQRHIHAQIAQWTHRFSANHGGYLSRLIRAFSYEQTKTLHVIAGGLLALFVAVRESQPYIMSPVDDFVFRVDGSE
jgi:hypothetical protein